VKSPVDLLQEQDMLQYATFLPNHGVLFVHNNDLYHLDRLPDGKVTRVTSSGVMGTIYNGVADWLYEGKGKAAGCNNISIIFASEK
jgi:hypothetical protein